MPSVVAQTAEQWAETDAAGIAIAGAVEGDYLLESDTDRIKIWEDDSVDYDDIPYSFQQYLGVHRAPMVQYRGSMAPYLDPEEHDDSYWGGMTAERMDELGIMPFDVLYEIDTGKWKIWDGIQDYDDLEYVTQTNAAVDYLLNVYGQVSIINMALGRLGASPIRSVEDNNPNARLALQYYRITVAEVMAAYDWTSAMTRKQLVRIPEEIDEEPNPEFNPYSGFRVQYRVPQAPRPVRVLHLFTFSTNAYQRMDTPFRLEGDYIYTDLENAGLVYIGDYSANTSKLDPFVIELIVLRLAARMCFSITSSPQLTQIIEQEYSMKMASAQFADASRSREATNIDVFPAPEPRWTEGY